MTRRRSILLDPVNGWGSGQTHGVGTLGLQGLHLSGQRSIAQLTDERPVWLAADGTGVLMLGSDGAVRRLDPDDVRRGLSQGSVIVDARDLPMSPDDLIALAASDEDVYLLDGRRHVILAVSRRGYLRAVLLPGPGRNRPVAVCGTGSGAAVILAAVGPDGAAQSAELRRHCTGDLVLGPPTPLPPGTWTRCFPGRDCRVWVVDTVAQVARAVGPDGVVSGQEFDGPGIGEEIGDLPAVVDDVVLLPPPLGLRDRAGRRVPRPDRLDAPKVPLGGFWISDALDSLAERTEWHRLVLEVGAALPDAVRLSTFTSDRLYPPAEIAALSTAQWVRTGPVAAGGGDVLVIGPAGRYLWLRIELRSDGYEQVHVRSVRAEYPRRSLLRLLPAVYAASPGASALGRFLAIPGSFVDEWDRQLGELPRYVDPWATRDDFVAYLSSWLDVPVEGTFRPDQQRRLLSAVRSYLSERGTVKGIRQHVAAYLMAISGQDVDPHGLPQLVEGFTRRNYLTLDSHERDGRPLWSLSRVARLQPDRYDRLGSVRLVDHGDPAVDLYTEHAHRLAVMVPADVVTTPAARRMLSRAIAQEAPAHVRASLVLVGPQLCLGAQSQLGIDTMLAAPEPVRLTCTASARGLPEADEQPYVPRLGGLSVLGCSRDDGGRLGRHSHDGSLLAVS
jgi:phage tail-like protein